MVSHGYHLSFVKHDDGLIDIEVQDQSSFACKRFFLQIPRALGIPIQANPLRAGKNPSWRNWVSWKNAKHSQKLVSDANDLLIRSRASFPNLPNDLRRML